MRYLKRFNEDLNRENLKDFCEDQLAYLLDDDLEIRVIDAFGPIPLRENNLLIRLIFSTNKFWTEMSDQLIPFLIRLKGNYGIYTQDINSEKPYQIRLYIKPIDPNPVNVSSIKMVNYMLDDIIEEKDLPPGFLFDYFKIEEIRIVVENDTTLIERPKPKEMNRLQKFIYKVGSL